MTDFVVDKTSEIINIITRKIMEVEKEHSNLNTHQSGVV